MSGIATLPIENPVLIFFIVLVIILFAPILLNRIRVPHIIGPDHSRCNHRPQRSESIGSRQ